MADAIIDVQTIKIDVNKKRNQDYQKEHYSIQLLKIISGFLILYNDKNDDSSESEKMEGQIELKKEVL